MLDPASRPIAFGRIKRRQEILQVSDLLDVMLDPCVGLVAGKDPRPQQPIETIPAEPRFAADRHDAHIARAGLGPLETVAKPERGSAQDTAADYRGFRID